MKQIFFFRDFDEDMRYVIKDTILGNEMFIAYIHLHHSFAEKSDPFWPEEIEVDSEEDLEDEELIGIERLEQSDVARLRIRNLVLGRRELKNARNVIAQYLRS